MNDGYLFFIPLFFVCGVIGIGLTKRLSEIKSAGGMRVSHIKLERLEVNGLTTLNKEAVKEIISSGSYWDNTLDVLGITIKCSDGWQVWSRKRKALINPPEDFTPPKKFWVFLK